MCQIITNSRSSPNAAASVRELTIKAVCVYLLMTCLALRTLYKVAPEEERLWMVLLYLQRDPVR